MSSRGRQGSVELSTANSVADFPSPRSSTKSLRYGTENNNHNDRNSGMESSIMSIQRRNSGSFDTAGSLGGEQDIGSTSLLVEEAEAPHRVSAIDIDVELVEEKLSEVNSFARRKQADKIQPVLMYEMTSNGENNYLSMSLRELLQYVNEEAHRLDVAAATAAATAAAATAATKVVNAGTVDGQQGKSRRRMTAPPATLNVLATQPVPPVYFDDILDMAVAGDGSNSSSSHGDAISTTTATTTGAAAAVSKGASKEDKSDPFQPSNVSPPQAVSELRLRDLRRLDFKFNPNEEKSVLVRRHAVLFAIDPMRAVVMASKIILIVPDGADSLLAILDQYMREWQQPLKPLTTTTTSQPEVGHTSTINNCSSNSNKSGNHDLQQSLAPILHLPVGGRNIVPDSSLRINTGHTNTNVSSVDTELPCDPNKGNDNTTESSTQQLLYAQPFESHAYDALLTTVNALISQEFDGIKSRVYDVLSVFKSGSLLSIAAQERMRAVKNDLSLLLSRISGSRMVLDDLTEDEEELALMNLTMLRERPALYNYPLVPEIVASHDEMEELLESYLFDFNSMESKIQYLQSQIQSAEELVSLRLDTSRNELLIANTVLGVLGCAIGFGAYVTGVFGMNLDNVGTIGNVPYLFTAVTASSAAAIALIFLVTVFYLVSSGMIPTKRDMNMKGGKR